MVTPAPLVGRDDESATLRGAWTAAKQGHGSLVVIAGEPGIGKSALIRDLGTEIELTGTAIVRGRAWEFADAPPYFPLWPVFRSLDLDWRQATFEGEFGAFHLWEEVLSRISEKGSSDPTVWLIDDLHAADILTFDLLAFLSQPLRALHALVVVTTRESDPRLTPAAEARLVRMRREGVDMRLRALDPRSAAALATSVAKRPLSTNTLSRLTSATGGNPLFLVECARSLEFGDVDESRLLPESVRQIVEERVRLLPDPTRDVLSAASVVGREFTAGIVASVLDTLPAKIIDELGSSLRNGLVHEVRPGTFAFSHAVVRDAIEGAVSGPDRKRLHHRALLALEAQPRTSERVLEQARHALSSTGDTPLERVREHIRAATELLVAEGAHDRALSLHLQYERVQKDESLPELPFSERLIAARTAAMAGSHRECARLCEAALQDARARSDGRGMGQAALILGSDLRPGTVDRRLVQHLRDSLAMIGDADPAVSCRLEARLAAAMQPAIDPTEPVALARRAIERARSLGEDVLLDVLYSASSALIDCVPVSESLTAAKELQVLATAAHDVPKELRARSRVAMELLRTGEIAAAEKEAFELLAFATELGHPRHRWRPLIFSSMFAEMRGEFDDAQRIAVELSEMAGLVDDPAFALTRAAHELSRVRLMHLDASIREVAAGIGGMMTGIPDSRFVSAILRASLYATVEDVNTLRGELRTLESDVIAGRGDPWLWATVAEAAWMVWPAELCSRLRALIASQAALYLAGYVAIACEGTFARAVALLDAACGRVDDALAALEQDRTRAATHTHRAWVAQLSYDIARVKTRAGRDAQREFHEALELAGQLGMPGLVARARAHAGSTATATRATHVSRPELSIQREGETYRIQFSARTVNIAAVRGMELIERLIARAGEEIHVLALSSDVSSVLVEETSDDALDRKAIAAYRARLAELRTLLDDAGARIDSGRVHALERERDALLGELRRAFGMHGARKSGSTSERARVNVQRRIRAAMDRIREADTELGDYLRRAIKTGTYCSFRP